MSNCNEKLFSEFKAPTRQEWLDKIQVDLKGADFNKRLVWRTNEGFDVPPFYCREDVLKLKTPDSLPGEFPYVRGNKKNCNCWYIRQNIDASDAKAANEKGLDILNRGVDSLGFKIPGDCVSKEFVDTLLNGIDCESVELNSTHASGILLSLREFLHLILRLKDMTKLKSWVRLTGTRWRKWS